MEEPKDLKMVKKVGKLDGIATGADSRVFSLTRTGKSEPSSVVKVYDENWLVQEEILKRYYEDTLRAKEILDQNPNPLNQSVVIDGKTFNLKYKIIPQGSVILDEAGIAHPVDGQKINLSASYGQEFVGGLNLMDLKEYSKRVSDNQLIIYDNVFLQERIEAMAREVFSFLSDSIEVKFRMSPMNIKPFVEKDTRNLTIFVTDLAATLNDTYSSQILKG